MSASEIRATLVRILRDLTGEHEVRIMDLQRVSEGFSRENWMFDAAIGREERQVRLPLILRRDPTTSLVRTKRHEEYAVLNALAKSDLPVPKPLWLDREGTEFGRPTMLMERVEGECDWRVLNGVAPLERRLDLAEELIDLLARVHSLNWGALGLGEVLASPGREAGRQAVKRWETEIRQVQLEPFPELEFANAWLLSSAPETQRIAVVHGDYKPGNILLCNGRISALLDWELSHLGDPLEDLGWVTNPYRSSEHQIDGHWGRSHIIDRYQRATGLEVAEDELLWWNVLACYKLAAIILRGVNAFLLEGFDRVYQAPTRLFEAMFALMERAGVKG